MCGIAGIVHPDTERFLPVVRRMTSALAHRGPDDEGLWCGDGVVLGHRRLSIIDLTEAGRQPMSAETSAQTSDAARTRDATTQQADATWVTLNGEIYNYRELSAALNARGRRFHSQTDTEVLPHLYEEVGLSFLEQLHGMFAFGLWDGRARRLILARDRLGKKPLFYAAIPGGLAFASEIKALACVPGIDRTVREQGIFDFLSFGVVPGPDTIYAGIKRVPPGNYLLFEPGGTPVVLPYWQLSLAPKHKISEAEALEEIERLLRQAISLRLRSDVPVGVFLSGGIDSGLITALAATMLDRPLRSYAIGFEDQQFDERPLARQVAERYGTDHSDHVLHSLGEDRLEAIIGHYDEPFADASALPSFAVAELAARDLKVVLNGDGGDELFCGYRHYVAARLEGALAGLPGLSASARGLLPFLPPPMATRSPYQFGHRFLRVLAAAEPDRYLVLTKDLMNEDDKARFFGNLRDKVPPLAHAARLLHGIAENAHAQDTIDRITAWNMTRLLADTLLVKMDIASMAQGLETRSPFLDQALVEFVARLPASLRLPGRTTKPLLRKLAARHLPPAIVTAPKRGFEIPLQQWMAGPLGETLRARLTDPKSFAADHFDRSAVVSFLTAGNWERKRWAGVAWTLLCLEIWWSRSELA